jgi:hypothetical protein
MRGSQFKVSPSTVNIPHPGFSISNIPSQQTSQGGDSCLWSHYTEGRVRSIEILGKYSRPYLKNK